MILRVVILVVVFGYLIFVFLLVEWFSFYLMQGLAFFHRGLQRVWVLVIWCPLLLFFPACEFVCLVFRVWSAGHPAIAWMMRKMWKNWG